MKLKKIYIISLVIFSLFFQACSTLATGNQSSLKSDSKTNELGILNSELLYKNPVQKEQEKLTKINIRDVKNSIGLVATNEKRYEKNSHIRIYNQDGSIWYKYTNLGEDSNTLKFDKDLLPFRKNAEELLLVFDCVGEDDQYYHVIVNDDVGLKKFIRKNDPIFKFEKWEDYILNCFAVDFNLKKNPMRREINGEVIKDSFQENETFEPKEIRGNWLKVKWHPDDNQKKPANFGWIKWKEDQKIVINFFETA